MGDRAWAGISIGGAVTKKQWKKVRKELEIEFGPQPSLKKLSGKVLELNREEAPPTPFEDLRKLLREAGLTYVVDQGGCGGAWAGSLTSYEPRDAHRDDETWSCFYNGVGEHYQELSDGDFSDRVAHSNNVRAAFEIAFMEPRMLTEQDDDTRMAWIRERVVAICFRVVSVPPLVLVE